MPTVNNVTRLLDSRRIAYQAYELPAAKLGALETARLLGVPAGSVFKTIVVIRPRPGKPILAVIPGPALVDLRALAAGLGEKKVQLPTEREVERLTGLQAGGISPLALLNRGFEVVIDSSAQSQGEIHISGGQRGLNLRMAATDLASLTPAKFLPIARPDAGGDGE
jgi:Cys-tRNA(Pro)/Cys-tRNA(Cys) deacylase